jgi:hypothetical protein
VRARETTATKGLSVRNRVFVVARPSSDMTWQRRRSHRSRVWSRPIPPDTYVDPEVVRAYLDGEAATAHPSTPRRYGPTSRRTPPKRLDLAGRH